MVLWLSVSDASLAPLHVTASYATGAVKPFASLLDDQVDCPGVLLCYDAGADCGVAQGEFVQHYATLMTSEIVRPQRQPLWVVVAAVGFVVVLGDAGATAEAPGSAETDCADVTVVAAAEAFAVGGGGGDDCAAVAASVVAIVAAEIVVVVTSHRP